MQNQINAPSFEYAQLAPMLIVFGAAIVGVLIEAFLPRPARRIPQLVVAIAGLVVALLWIVGVPGVSDGLRGTRHVAAVGAIGIDGPGLFLQGLILALSLVAVLLAAERGADGEEPFVAQASAVPGSAAERAATRAGITQTEVLPLMMFAVGGMMMFVVANDLITMFVGLEVLSLPLYLLCALARRRRLLSQEAALKYFLLGGFSSAFFVYGIALLYGYAGTVRLSGIADAVSGHCDASAIGGQCETVLAAGRTDALLLIGMGLLGVGLLFKIGAVPFHVWKPDVYQGAPTPITGFMAAAVMVAAFGALVRVFYVAFFDMRWDWRPAMWAVAIVTMLIGSIVAITQTDMKRMLAYSSIAHAGFILTGLVATSAAGLSATLFYLAAYGFVTLGAFAVITLVRDAGGEATHLSRWAGLGKRSPVVAGVFALFLLAFAGIPLTSGFTAKYSVFLAAMDGGATPLVIIGLISSAIAAFFYVRVIVLMFFSDPPLTAPTVAFPSVLTVVAVTVGLAVTVFLGVYPQPVLDLANGIGPFVR
ncbi:MAG TPA: NADH-quinone oxidoreductase subunit NuoN [Actinomycetes bacterium]|nr:NADH-quinone oxidoreductase subunit NuoN [Actinomycetes bacterium]